jgi:formyltetrahydrofolate dehydrogenase
MVVKILGDKTTEAYMEAAKTVKMLGHAVWDETYYYIDVAIAPLLTTKLTGEELAEPNTGTLIFHPSPLPYGRGASSIRWAYRRNEPITAATWFWADSGLDTGPICEQEIVKIDYTMAPREFYRTHIIPAMCRTLERCLNALENGLKREIPQVEIYASYDRIIK